MEAGAQFSYFTGTKVQILRQLVEAELPAPSVWSPSPSLAQNPTLYARPAAQQVQKHQYLCYQNAKVQIVTLRTCMHKIRQSVRDPRRTSRFKHHSDHFLSVDLRRYSVYLLYWYKGGKTDACGAAQAALVDGDSVSRGGRQRACTLARKRDPTPRRRACNNTARKSVQERIQDENRRPSLREQNPNP